jgi:hypothetical protein
MIHVKRIVAGTVMALTAGLTLIGILSATPALAATTHQPVDYHGCKFWGEGHESRATARVYIRQDNCGRSQGDYMRAAAHCVTLSGLNPWVYGPSYNVAGYTSHTSDCPADTLFIGSYGYQFRYWPWGQPHHHRATGYYQLGATAGAAR